MPLLCDLKILVGLLAAPKTLNRHLTLLNIKECACVPSLWRRIWYQSIPSWKM